MHPKRFFAEVNKHAKRFMSDAEHFMVDGRSLIQAWASLRAFAPRTAPTTVMERTSTVRSAPIRMHEFDHRRRCALYKKSVGQGIEGCYLGHALVENRNGLIAADMVTHADGYAEGDAALLMLAEKQEGRSRRITVGADKAYDTVLISSARA